MTRNEAVRTISRISGGSISYAEDLYDSFFPKPVVPQCVADWYEGNKRNIDTSLCALVYDLTGSSIFSVRGEMKAWVNDNKKTFITTLVNMHQFGYEVEEDKKYIVKFKNFRANASYLKQDLTYQEYYLGGTHVNKSIILEHTREELELNGLGWVFDCPGVEVKEVE